MSYRAFKRLLGETSLERKCRLLLGTGVLILMTGSFWIYARQTEDIAYEQLKNSGRVLLTPIFAELHVKGDQLRAVEDFHKLTEAHWPASLKGYNYRLIKPNSKNPEFQPGSDDLDVLLKIQSDPLKNEESRHAPKDNAFYYYGAIRAEESCINCHRDPAKVGDKANAALTQNELMTVVRVRLSTTPIEEGFHKNRAVLISFAIGTSLLIMAGSYLIIRYVIVKPVKHLKEVSEAIAMGELNIRSEIQTGDEFEDLSHAFNRMLRNLTNIQDRNKKLIADLDRKVDELARVNMALFESNRLKSEFLSTMSHELRTPLNSIIGFSEVFLTAENLTDKQLRYAGNIMTSGQRLLALINDVLDLAKLEAGKMRLHPETLNSRDRVRTCRCDLPPASREEEHRPQGDGRRRRPASPPGCGEAASDPHQPAVERGEVHAGRGAGDAQGRLRRQRPGLHGRRHRRRHRPGGAGPDLREVPAGGEPDDARTGRHGTGAFHRPGAGQAPPRRRDTAQRSRPRQHLHRPRRRPPGRRTARGFRAGGIGPSCACRMSIRGLLRVSHGVG